MILVGCGGLMADGAIFGHVANAAALVPGPVRAADMTALVVHHASRGLVVGMGGPSRTFADLARRPAALGGAARGGAGRARPALTTDLQPPERSRPCGACQSITGLIGTIRFGLMVSWL